MIELNHVEVKSILRIPHLQFLPGKFYGVVGPNGAGKSTLIKTIALEHDYSGTIAVYDNDLKYWERTVRARHLAVLPQASHLSFNFSGREVIKMGAIPLQASVKSIDDEVIKLINSFNLHSFIDQPFPSLSGGEKQRIQLARILLQVSQASRPAIVLLDEPISAQDLSHQHLLLSYLKQFAVNGNMVIAVIHDINHAAYYCDDLVVMIDGKVSTQGNTKTIINQENILQYWQHNALPYLNSNREHTFFY